MLEDKFWIASATDPRSPLYESVWVPTSTEAQYCNKAKSLQTRLLLAVTVLCLPFAIIVTLLVTGETREMQEQLTGTPFLVSAALFVCGFVLHPWVHDFLERCSQTVKRLLKS